MLDTLCPVPPVTHTRRPHTKLEPLRPLPAPRADQHTITQGHRHRLHPLLPLLLPRPPQEAVTLKHRCRTTRVRPQEAAESDVATLTQMLRQRSRSLPHLAPMRMSLLPEMPPQASPNVPRSHSLPSGQHLFLPDAPRTPHHPTPKGSQAPVPPPYQDSQQQALPRPPDPKYPPLPPPQRGIPASQEGLSGRHFDKRCFST